jgi:hypothetical protein
VGVDGLNPIEELKRIDQQVGVTSDVGALKPLYSRVNEIAQHYPGDFDVQFLASEVKDRLMARGKELKKDGSVPPAVPPTVPSDATTSIWTATAMVKIPEKPPAPVAASAAARPQAVAVPGTAPVAVRPRTGFRWSGDLTRLLVGLLAASLVIAFLLVQTLKRIPRVPKVIPVDVAIVTSPPGAAVQVAPSQPIQGARESRCQSNCQLQVLPGRYQVTASLDGFEPSAGLVTVLKGERASVNLALQPLPQTVRVLTDLDQGKVTLDDQPPVDLQEGQFVLEKAPAGSHTLKIAGKNGDASFAFELAPARIPAITGAPGAHNLIALVVASYGRQARLVSSAGPLKLTVNGQGQTDAGPAGTDVSNFQPGVNEIVLGDGKNQHNMSESFPAAPMLTAFLKTDVNAGTLIVSTGLDDVRVFLNDREYRRRTQRGQLRIQTLGKVTVRAAKAGYLDEPPQTVEVKKGAEVRLQFDLKAQPQFGSLVVRGAAAGTEVWVDQTRAGVVGQDGGFTSSTIAPGEHTVELRRDQHVAKRLLRTFRAGQQVALGDADVLLAMATGKIRLNRNPAGAAVTFRRTGEPESHEASGSQFELPAGNYTFSATAPGFQEASVVVPLGAGETREVEFRLLASRPVAAPAPVVVTGGMGDFEDPSAWHKDGDAFVRKGGGFVPYKLAPKGVFTFTVELLKGGGIFRSGAIRWCVQYLDSKTYLLYEVDRKNFWAGVVEKGKKYERIKTQHSLEKQKAFTIQIEVLPDKLVHKLRVGNEWQVLDTFTEQGRDFTQGKFGFWVQGNDEIGISSFKFTGK